MASDFNPKDFEILQKIGVSSLLDLALLLPVSIEDYSLSKEPNFSSPCTTQIKVISAKTTSKFLSIEAYALLWQQNIKIIIFNARPWHYAVFKKDKELIIHGKFANFAGYLNICNPKILKESGSIKAHYKLALKDEKIIALKEKYLNKENLKNCALNDDEINLILALNKNDLISISLLANLQNDKKVLNQLKFLEIFNYLKKLNSKKRYFKANAFEPQSINEWIKSLPFAPTNDQINAFNDISNDLKSDIAKRRVIMGDVGSGKSLIMFATALMCKEKKSIIMAPTSILATQLYEEAKKFLPSDFNIFFIRSGQKDEIDFSSANLIIGTHVLLYKKLPSVAAIMIDEQHRFGSAQRQKIELLTASSDFRAHILQFSATPIPRTLALINSAFVSYSFLKQLPFTRQIKTKIIKNKDFNALLEHIKEQISLKQQVIIVYPLVNENENAKYASLNEAKEFWQKNFNNVYITHGGDKQKDEIMANFAKDGDILLSTTIIEVGISLPRLSSIIIVGAERLGLASLHQLRGRVGRYGNKGWCFLFTKLNQAPQRLVQFCNTLDGFEIANIDYKNRQAGDILEGSVQHGATFNFYEMEEDLANLAKNRLGIFE